MQSKTIEYFPTLFYEFRWTIDELRPLLDEMHEKKDKVKEKYYELWPNEEDHVHQYWTDHSDAIKLSEYDKLIDEISAKFLPHLQCKSFSYWTAISGETGYHATHQHNGMLYQAVNSFEAANMSSVLYLSPIGMTHFFNPNQLGTADQELFIRSEVGKLIMFPAHILHRSIPHRQKGLERIVISANWLLQETAPGDFTCRDRDGGLKWASVAHSQEP